MIFSLTRSPCQHLTLVLVVEDEVSQVVPHVLGGLHSTDVTYGVEETRVALYWLVLVNSALEEKNFVQDIALQVARGACVIAHLKESDLEKIAAVEHLSSGYSGSGVQLSGRLVCRASPSCSFKSESFFTVFRRFRTRHVAASLQNKAVDLVRMVVLQTGQYFYDLVFAGMPFPVVIASLSPWKSLMRCLAEVLPQQRKAAFVGLHVSSVSGSGTGNSSLSIRVIKRVEFEVCHALEKSDVEYTLRRFVVEVRKANGDDYPGKTLYTLLVLLQFKLEKHGYHWKILNDDEFLSLRNTLENLMKERAGRGLGRPNPSLACHAHSHQQALGVWGPWRRYAGEVCRARFKC